MSPRAASALPSSSLDEYLARADVAAERDYFRMDVALDDYGVARGSGVPVNAHFINKNFEVRWSAIHERDGSGSDMERACKLLLLLSDVNLFQLLLDMVHGAEEERGRRDGEEEDRVAGDLAAELECCQPVQQDERSRPGDERDRRLAGRDRADIRLDRGDAGRDRARPEREHLVGRRGFQLLGRDVGVDHQAAALALVLLRVNDGERQPAGGRCAVKLRLRAGRELAVGGEVHAGRAEDDVGVVGFELQRPLRLGRPVGQ